MSIPGQDTSVRQQWILSFTSMFLSVSLSHSLALESIKRHILGCGFKKRHESKNKICPKLFSFYWTKFHEDRILFASLCLFLFYIVSLIPIRAPKIFFE